MGGITRRTLLETQAIKESQITHPKILDHTLGSQEFGTTAGIIIYGTQIKDDIIVASHILDHTLGSQHLGTSVAIIVEGTQIKDDLIGSEHLEAAAVSYAAQVKDAIITPEKSSELQLHGTIAGVRVAGTYIIFGTAFGGTPDLLVTPENVGPGTFPYIETKTSGSARVLLTGSGTIVCDYIAIGPWT